MRKQRVSGRFLLLFLCSELHVVVGQNQSPDFCYQTSMSLNGLNQATGVLDGFNQPESRGLNCLG